MGTITADQMPALAVGDTQAGAVSFAGQLDTSEVLTGTPTITEQTTSDLTITNKVVSTAALTINGESVAIGEAVTFAVSGQQLTGSPYTIKIVVSTDSSPARTLTRYVKFEVPR